MLKSILRHGPYQLELELIYSSSMLGQSLEAGNAGVAVHDGSGKQSISMLKFGLGQAAQIEKWARWRDVGSPKIMISRESKTSQNL